MFIDHIERNRQAHPRLRPTPDIYALLDGDIETRTRELNEQLETAHKSFSKKINNIALIIGMVFICACASSVVEVVDAILHNHCTGGEHLVLCGLSGIFYVLALLWTLDLEMSLMQRRMHFVGVLSLVAWALAAIVWVEFYLTMCGKP